MAIDILNQSNDGDWSNASNWSTGSAPKPGDIVIINGGKVSATHIRTNWDFIWLDSATQHTTLDFDANLGLGSFVLLSGTSDADSFSSFVLHDTAMRGVVLSYDDRASLDITGNTMNYGWIGTAGKADMNIIVSTGSFVNDGVIEVANQGKSFLESNQQIDNYGLIKADTGGSIEVSSSGPNGTLANHGVLDVNGGTMLALSKIVQDATASINIENNGSLNLQGPLDGGVIKIQSGMLALGPIETQPFLQNGVIEFTGQTATLDLSSVGLRAQFSEVFQAATNELQVTVSDRGVAVETVGIHLQGVYSAADFSMQGSSILYTAHPQAASG